MLCHQRFVGGSHALSGQKTSFYKGICRLDAAHYFYHDLYIIILDDGLKIMHDLFLHRIARKILQIQNIFDIQFFSDPLVDTRAVCVYHFHHAGTNGSISHYRYVDHKLPPFSCLLFPLDTH